MTNRICVIGFFAFNSHYNGGQENKTRALGKLLTDKYGANNVICIDTMNWKKHPLSLLSKVIKASHKADSFIMLPAQNGVHVVSSLLLRFKRKKIFYSVIGGWLPKITLKNNKLKKKLSKFHGIWVETESMHQSLVEQGFSNTKVLPNFKVLEAVQVDDLPTIYEKPYKFCTFSRVLKEKGIEDAISVISSINNEYGDGTAELDIFGVVDAGYVAEFEEFKKRFPSYIKYAGVVPYDKTAEVLRNYYALLFPTHYYTEGIPGTIIDAYAAGVPVLSAEWESFSDIVHEGRTGFGYRFGDIEEFNKLVCRCIENPELIYSIKASCIEEYEKYTDTYAFNLIEKELNK